MNKGLGLSFAEVTLPRMGERPMMTLARADLTCWLASVTNSLTQGSSWVMITCSCTPLSRFRQKSFTL